MAENLVVGDIVFSQKGHDSGSYYMVVEVINADYVMIADGAKRKLSSPKLKNAKHLRATGERLTILATKLADGVQVFDTELKRSLRAFNQTE